MVTKQDYVWIVVLAIAGYFLFFRKGKLDFGAPFQPEADPSTTQSPGYAAQGYNPQGV